MKAPLLKLNNLRACLSVLDELFKTAVQGRFPQLLDSLCLDLPYPLPGYFILLCDFFEGAGVVVSNAEPQPQYPLFFGIEREEQLFDLPLQVFAHYSLERTVCASVLDEIAQVSVVFSYRRLK